jgi:hypothetical protein
MALAVLLTDRRMTLGKTPSGNVTSFSERGVACQSLWSSRFIP